MSVKRILIVGIGSAHGDDRIGWLVADRLVAMVESENVEVRHAKSPIDLLDWLAGVERLVICDACRGLGRVGEMRRWEWPTTELSAIGLSGTHGLSVPTVLKLADRLGRLPEVVVVWAIEGAGRGTSGLLSTELTQALPELVSQIVGELNEPPLLETNTCTNSR
ncbi:MAG: hydrogenase maturation protease [Planctomycetes bacterium]|nr:hydrogenase maturation protease [Planctomycetota bacterium]